MKCAYRWQKHFVFLILFLSFTNFVLAQTAGFTTTPAAGCSPLPVNFKNTSAGFSAAATYKWDFGNGNTSALKDNVGATYQDPHDYKVTLTVTDGGKAYTKTSTVTVYKKPTADFSANTAKGCLPLPVIFTSNSTAGDGTISSYFWDYGDGTAEAGPQEPAHTYTTPSTISASLTVTNSFGCYSTASKANILKVLPNVTVNFEADETVLCKVTDATSFTNTSTGTGTLEYAWDFGDGKTSGEKTPSHVWNKKGTYTIKLKVQSSDGCTAGYALADYINVANFTTDFEVPPLICENTPATFTDKSNPKPYDYSRQQWIVDGQPYYSEYFRFYYTFTSGKHTMQVVNRYGACSDTATKQVTVYENPKTEGFTADLQNACGAPATVMFKDTIQGATKWEWDFANFNYIDFAPSAFTQATSYTYNNDNRYSIMLRTTNAIGCTTYTSKKVDISKPNATISSSAGIYGCDSLHTVFSASSSVKLKQTNWNFGDGSATSTDQEPRHTFKKAGNFTITLSYVNENDCKGTATFQVYITGNPSFDFIATPGTTICGTNPVSFTISGANTTGYRYWNFGDNGYTNDGNNNTHQYYSDSLYTVSLVIVNQGCSDTVTKKNYITVLPPFPKISSRTNTCDGTRGLVTFEEASIKPAEWIWNFGDGSPLYTYNSVKTGITHYYDKTGSYKVTLTTRNGGCTLSTSMDTYVLLKQSPFLSTQQKEVCGSATLPVTVSQLETNPAPHESYSPDFNVHHFEYGDGSRPPGNYTSPDYNWRNTFQLNIYDLSSSEKDLRIVTNSYYFGCTDTTNYIPIKVKGPDAGFLVKNNDTCFKVPLFFTDTSKSSNEVPVVKWDWNFGDGNAATKTSGSPFEYRYTYAGNYNVMLTITDKDGCTATARHYDVVTKGPQASFSMSQNPVLPNIDVIFYNNSNTNGTDYYDNKFRWFLGDGATVNDAAYYDYPRHNYANTGIDTIMLIAKNEVTKCVDTAVQYLRVSNVLLSYTYTTTFLDPVKSCPPMLASFTNTSQNTQSVSWDFGDGTTASDIDYPSHIYDKPGKYKVTLYGNFYDDSIDSTSDYITIQGPFATLKADKFFACGAQPVTLSAVAANTTSYTWDFGDGTLTDATDTFFVHNYLTPGSYTPSLVVKDGNQCSFPFFLDKPIIIDTLHLSINTNPAIICDASGVLFTPDIVSVAKDAAGASLTYHWNFGTGSPGDTANTESPAFLYNKTGTYPVTFTASSPYGCAAATTAAIIVNHTPVANITGPSSLCQDDYGTFAATTNVNSSSNTWLWHFPNNHTATAQNPLQETFSTPGIDSVMLLVSNNGCTDTVFSKLTVLAKPVIDLQPKNPQVCAGASVQLQAHDGIKYQWLPGNAIENAAIANPLVSPPANAVYKVNVTNSNGCVNQDSVTVRVTQRFKVAATPLLYICIGSAKQLIASGADEYEWISGNNLSNTHVSNPVSTTITPQTYKVVGRDKDHCFTDTATTEVRIDELPSIKAGDDAVVFAGSELKLNTVVSNDVTIWTWLPADYLSCSNCPAPVSTPQSNILYIVEAATAHGCTAKDSIQIHVICKQSLVQIPSAFTPNGDRNNDRFLIKGQGIKQISHFVVFSRSGETMFQKTNISANDPDAGWDGTYKGLAMSSGTYVYMADIVCSTGEVYHYKGAVTLIR